MHLIFPNQLLFYMKRFSLLTLLTLAIALLSFYSANAQQASLPPTASLVVDVDEGYAPLTINFDATGSTDDNGIVSYTFELGQGITETNTTGRLNYTYEDCTGYSEASVTVMDAEGQTDTEVVELYIVEPPNAMLSTNVVDGTAPLSVRFTAFGSTYLCGDDYEGWYTFEPGGEGFGSDVGPGSQNMVGEYRYTYTEIGTHTATVEISDGQFSASDTVYITVSEPPVIAELQATPTSGMAPLTVSFDATGSTASTFDFGPEYFFDLDGDGIQDFRLDEGKVSYTYLTPGVYTATVTVQDWWGTRDTESVTITVEEPPSLRFQLVNRARDVLDMNLEDGDVINLFETGDIEFNIQAIPDPMDVGSVVFELSGARNLTRIESVEPYELFGNGAQFLRKGSYTLTATPFSGSGGSGEAGTPQTINFEVVNNPTADPTVVSFDLVDANGLVVQNLQDGAIIDLNELGDQPFNILANTIPPTPKDGVRFELSGVQAFTRTEIEPPYTLFPSAEPLAIGAYNLTATPIIDAETGKEGSPLTISFEVVIDPDVMTFRLVDADRNVLIGNVTEGTVINLTDYPTGTQFNIQAITEPAGVGSVDFDLTGGINLSRVENFAPYEVFGNGQRGLPVGSYTISATAFSDPGASGIAGASNTVSFEVIDGQSLFEGNFDVETNSGFLLPENVTIVTVNPNPALNRATLRIESATTGMARIQIIDFQGAIVRELQQEKTAVRMDKEIDLMGLASGAYTARVFLGDQQTTARFVISN